MELHQRFVCDGCGERVAPRVTVTQALILGWIFGPSPLIAIVRTRRDDDNPEGKP